MKIAVTGSPNEITSISIDVLQEHTQTPILGSLVRIDTSCTINDRCQEFLILGQVSSLKTQNRWHENVALKNYIKLRGTLPNLTTVGDVTTGKVQIVGTYSLKSEENGNISYTKARMSVPVGSGLEVKQTDGNLVRELVKDEPLIGFLGKFYGTQDVPAPVMARHFGDFRDNGTGEAYMGGVFGPSGSGKSVIGACMALLYARNRSMGVLILDPQSEFSANKFSAGQEFQFDFHSLLKSVAPQFDPDVDIVTLDRIKLDGGTMFGTLLGRKKILKVLGVGAPKIPEAKEELIDEITTLKDKKKGKWKMGTSISTIKQNDLTLYEDIRAAVVHAASKVYAGNSRDNQRALFANKWEEHFDEISRIWDSVSEMFGTQLKDRTMKVSVSNLVRGVMSQGNKVILDLNPSHLDLDDEDKLFIMSYILKQVSKGAHEEYKSDESKANCLIVMDESERYIPESPLLGMEKATSAAIVRYVKELRKYRIGFQFIAQNVTSIKKDIYRNLHYRIYGVGLSVGADAVHMVSREGQEAFDMYNALPDPRLSKTYSYMVCGAIIALGTTGKPMYIEGYGSDAEFLRENGKSFVKANRAIIRHGGVPGVNTDIEW